LFLKVNLGQLVPLRSSFSNSYRKNIQGLVEQGFLQAGWQSCHPSISVKAPKATQSTNSNQWLGLILSSYTTGLLAEEALVPLHQLSAASKTKTGAQSKFQTQLNDGCK